MIWRGYILLVVMLLGFSLFGEEYYRDPGGIRSGRASLGPVFGKLLRLGPTRSTIQNDFSAGLALNVPLSQLFAFELQGLYGLDSISAPGLSYGANEYSASASLKLGFNVGPLRPYLGVGGQFSYHDNVYQYSLSPDTWIGSIQGMAGLDLELSRHVIVGVRATGSQPVLNRGGVYGFSAPSFVSVGLDPINNFSWLLTAHLWFVL